MEITVGINLCVPNEVLTRDSGHGGLGGLSRGGCTHDTDKTASGETARRRRYRAGEHGAPAINKFRDQGEPVLSFGSVD